ncbi:hypothetical protein ACP6JB_006522 [Aspergillus fumigatus]
MSINKWMLASGDSVHNVKLIEAPELRKLPDRPLRQNLRAPSTLMHTSSNRQLEHCIQP